MHQLNEEPKVTIEARKLVIEDTSVCFSKGTCVGCGAKGHLIKAQYGYPHGQVPEGIPDGALVHQKDCPLDSLLDAYGKMR